VCLLPSTVAMGATVPVMSLVLAETRAGGAGEIVSRAYAINTLGAVAGSWAAGMHLVPALGQRGTLVVAHAMNFTSGTLACALSRRRGGPVAPPKAEAPVPAASRPLLVHTAYFALGALALALEVLWFRILAIYCTGGNMTFAAGLTVYLVGFALGSG